MCFYVESLTPILRAIDDPRKRYPSFSTETKEFLYQKFENLRLKVSDYLILSDTLLRISNLLARIKENSCKKRTYQKLKCMAREINAKVSALYQEIKEDPFVKRLLTH